MEPGPCASHENPDLWISLSSKDNREAKVICGSCPAATFNACYEFGAKHWRWPGIYGGLSGAQRRRHGAPKPDQAELRALSPLSKREQAEQARAERGFKHGDRVLVEVDGGKRVGTVVSLLHRRRARADWKHVLDKLIIQFKDGSKVARAPSRVRFATGSRAQVPSGQAVA